MISGDKYRNKPRVWFHYLVLISSLTFWFIWFILKSETTCTFSADIYTNISCQDPNGLSWQHSRKTRSYYFLLPPSCHQPISATIWVPSHCWVDWMLYSFLIQLFALHQLSFQVSTPCKYRYKFKNSFFYYLFSAFNFLSWPLNQSFVSRLINHYFRKLPCSSHCRRKYSVAISCDSGFLCGNPTDALLIFSMYLSCVLSYTCQCHVPSLCFQTLQSNNKDKSFRYSSYYFWP